MKLEEIQYEKYIGVKCIVPISGGKDSQACMKLALEKYKPKEILGLFCDTKFEHPLTYAHVNKIQQLYGVDILTVNDGDVLTECEKYKRFPGGGSRHCTSKLKIRPTKIFLKHFSLLHGACEVWYGMRSGESNERKIRYSDKISNEVYPPHEIMPSNYPKYLYKNGVVFRLPILDWSSEQVLEYLGDERNPLYNSGFDRVGCFPCLMAGDKHKEKAFQFDDFGKNQYIEVQKVSAKIGKNIFTTKGGIERNSGCSICSI